MAGVIRSRHAVRLGFSRVKGVPKAEMELLVQRRGTGYDSVRDLWLRSGLKASVIARLAEADAFRSLGLDRREALWAVKALDDAGAAEHLPLFDRSELRLRENEAEVALPAMPPGQHIVHDYRTLSLSLKGHPVAFLRARLDTEKIVPNARLNEIADGRRVCVAGLVLVRQRPGKGNVIFMTIEDEDHIANIIVWPKIFERFRPVVLGARLIRVTGKLQKASDVIHVVADRLEDVTQWLGVLSERAPPALVYPDAKPDGGPAPDSRDKGLPREGFIRLPARTPTPSRGSADELARQTASAMPKGRNFH